MKKFSLDGVSLLDVKQVEICYLPLIEELYLYGDANTEIEECPKLSFPNLKHLKIERFAFKQMDKFTTSELPNL